KAGTKHVYRVFAVNTMGLKSKPSAEAVASPPHQPARPDPEPLSSGRVAAARFVLVAFTALLVTNSDMLAVSTCFRPHRRSRWVKRTGAPSLPDNISAQQASSDHCLSEINSPGKPIGGLPEPR